ncbi:MAG: hypothetical protein A2014_03070 [Spirochaetes bacterium GWF1_49_6]|nr:MAG: hypothetical protein A2014_03070 [Spirochaetes bacterium GWF1_49_6]
MKEIKDTRQIPGEGFRRWFNDDLFDLFVWYADKNSPAPLGFQLCYGKSDTGGIRTDRALTWKPGEGFSHNAIDTGRYSATEHRSPILVADGLFPKKRIVPEFDARSGGIDPAVRDFVLSKLKEF